MPRLDFAANSGLQHASPVRCQSIQILGMNCGDPAPSSGLRLGKAGVLQPPSIQVLSRAIGASQPHKAWNRVDDCTKLRVRDARFVAGRIGMDRKHRVSRLRGSCHF